MALCSESTGSSVAPEWPAASIISVPAETRASLLAKASVFPPSSAASTGISPAQPTIAAIVQSAPRRAASITAFSPAAASMPDPAKASFKSPKRVSSAITAYLADVARAAFARPSTSERAVSATISKASGVRRIRSSVDWPTEPVAPSMVTLLRDVMPPAPPQPPTRQAAPRSRARQAGQAPRHAPEAGSRCP